MFFKDGFPTSEEAFSKAVSNAVKRGEEVIDGFWNILEHEDFPFITLTSTTNTFRNFPPYNIIEETDGKVRLEMAVAGYTKDRIKVEKEGSVLIIQGSPGASALCGTNDVVVDRNTGNKDLYRHKGISNAAFLRTFDMNVHAEVGAVSLADGILTVYVNTTKPATPHRSTFEIK